jgi:hypothetical protein
MLSRPLAVLTAVLVGLLAGAMVLIEVVLVPFRRGLRPAELRACFAAHSGRVRSLMVPLGAGAAATTSAVAHRVEGTDGGTASLAAAGAMVAVVAITVVVNEPANRRFVAGNITGAETEALLACWARWHDRRVALGLSATVAAALALACRDG